MSDVGARQRVQPAGPGGRDDLPSKSFMLPSAGRSNPNPEVKAATGAPGLRHLAGPGIGAR